MERSVRDILNLYNPHDPLDHAWTIPSPWYFDARIGELEQQSVFAKTWQAVGRADQQENAIDNRRGLAYDPDVNAACHHKQRANQGHETHILLGYVQHSAALMLNQQVIRHYHQAQPY